ncbi:MAG: hypothetical protein HND57_04620 [Planctomycetes bacterium]|nr:hypothetical protein [Planctomycetota bacterium]
MTGTPSRHATSSQTPSSQTQSSSSDLPLEWETELNRLLDRQRDVCKRLESCSTRQRQLLAADKGDQLVELLAERQTLIDQLLQIATSLEPFREAWSDLWQAMSPERRQQLTALIDDVQGAVDRIIASDQEDQDTLRQAKDRVERELNAVATGQTAHRNYGFSTAGRHAGQPNKFVDHQG